MHSNNSLILPGKTTTLHPAIEFLYALGYQSGDRVTGRNIQATKSREEKGKNTDWQAILGQDNLDLKEYRWIDGKIIANGPHHQDGLSWLHQENNLAQKQIYFNVNAGRRNAEIKLAYAAFFESDRGTFAEQQLAIDNFKIPPTAVVRTRKSKHTYYKLNRDDSSLDNWTNLQERISLYQGSDPAVKDGPRLMRLPGFNHVLWDGERFDYTLCELEICQPERNYSKAEIIAAMDDGISQPYSPQRYRAYNFACGKRNLIKQGWNYPLLDPDKFRTCQESELEELYTRLRLYVRLVDLQHKKGSEINPDTAWTDSLAEIKYRHQTEVEVATVTPTINPNSLANSHTDDLTLIHHFARLYGYGWHRAGTVGARQNWDTCQCPVHGSSTGSADNLHINRSDFNYEIGTISCKSGCPPVEIINAFRHLAKDAGDETWNWDLANISVGAKHSGKKSLVASDKLSTRMLRPYKIGMIPWEITKEQSRINTLSYQPNQLLNQEFFTEKVANTLPKSGLILIRSPKGSGKSRKIIRPLIAELKSQNKRILSITPRVLLGIEQCHKFDMIWIDQFSKVKHQQTTASVGCCWDSLWKIADEQWDVVIIDEVRMGLKHLLTSTTAVQNRRPEILKKFRELINRVTKNGGLVLLADADLTDTEAKYIHSMCAGNTPVYTLVNRHLGKIKKCTYYTGEKDTIREQLMSAIAEQVELKETDQNFAPIVVCADSQKELEALERHAIKNYPQLGQYSIRIDGKTSGDEKSKDFISQPDAWISQHKPLVLWYSPAMSIGVSIESDWFKQGFGFYFGVLEPGEFRQMMARCRQLSQFTLWTEEIGKQPGGNRSYLPTNVSKNYTPSMQDSLSTEVWKLASEIAMNEAIEQGIGDNQFTDLMMNMIKTMRGDNSWQNPHLIALSEIQARENYAKSQCGVQLRQELIDEDNFEIIDSVSEAGKIGEEIAREKEAIKREDAELLAEGALSGMDLSQAINVLGHPLSSYQERKKAEGVKLRYFLPGVNLNADFILERKIKDPSWLTQNFLYWLAIHPQECKILDAAQIKSHLIKWSHGDIFLPDLHLQLPKAQLIGDLGLLKLVDNGVKYNAKSEEVQEIQGKAISYKREIWKQFNLTYDNHKSVIRLIGELLKRIGLKQVMSRINSDVRWYDIEGQECGDRKAVLLAWDQCYWNLRNRTTNSNSSLLLNQVIL
jgi:hypothetical protein